MLKRVLSIVLAAAMILSLAAFASAEGPGIFAAKASNEKAAPGETVTVTVSATQNDGVASVGIEVGYNATAMTLDSVTCETDVFGTADYTAGDLSKNPTMLSYTYIAAPTAPESEWNKYGIGKLATLTFTIKDDCPDGDYPITLSANNAMICGAFNVDYDELEMPLTSGKITVKSASDEPGEEADENVNVYVVGQLGGSVSATGCTAGKVDEVALGTEITATATPSEGFNFSYWKNTAGTALSVDEEYTFTANTNTAIIAVFTAEESEEATDTTLEFWNGDGGFIEKKIIDKGTSFGSAKITAPTITGYIFDKWSVEDTDVINKLTRAVALYKESDKGYTVYVGGNPLYTGKKYGEEVTVASNNASFASWNIGDAVASYDKNYTFYVWGDVYLTEVTGTVEKAVPTIAIDNFEGTNFIYYNVPSGYTKLEAGLVFSASGKPTVASCYSKAIAKESKSYGQFTAVPNSGETVVRGYLIFKVNETGETRVLYAD